MVQAINQDVTVEFKVVGGEAAIQSLTAVEQKISNIQRNAAAMSGTFNKAMKNAGTNTLNSSLDGTSKKLSGVQAQAKKAQIALRDVSGALTSTPMSALNAPRVVTMKDLRGSASGYGMKTAPPVGSVSGWEKVQNSIKGVQRAIPDAVKGLGGMGSAFTSASTAAEKASWNFFRTRAAIAAVAMVIGVLGIGLKSWFDLASDYAEANHLFYTTLASSLRDVSDAEKTAEIQGRDLFGNITGEALAVTPAIKAAADQVDRFASSMMLDPTNVKRTYATFYEMANSAGMATEKITNLAQGMTQLTYDLSSLWDMPFAETASKLQSGISGISTAVKSYGIDISRTAADQWLLTNGFDASYNSLDRANKMIVMYNMLMAHTMSAQGDLARSALQPANMLRILGEQASIAGRMMGAAVFPVLTKLIPLFIMLAQAIQRAAAALSAFLGSKLGNWYKDAADQWNNYMSNLSAPFGGGGMDTSGLDDVADGLGGVGDSASDAANAVKELNDYVMGFDELNVLPDQSRGAGGGGGGGGGGGLGGGGIGGLDIPIADAYPFTDLTSMILGDAQKTLDTLKRKIDEVFDPGTAEAFGRAVNIMWDTVKSNAQAVFEAVTNVMKAFDPNWDWVDFIDNVALGFKTANDTVTAIITTVLNAVPGLKDFLENLPIVGDLFKVIFDNLDSGLGIMVGVAIGLVPFRAAWKLLTAILKPIVGIVKSLFKPFEWLVGKIQNVIKPAAEAGEAVKGLGGKLAEAAGATKLGKFVKGVGKAFGPVGVVLAIANGLDQIATVTIPNAMKRWSDVFTSSDPLGEFIRQMQEYVMSGEWIDNILGMVLWKGALEDLQNLWKTVSDAAWKFGSDVGTAISEKFNEVTGIFRGFGENASKAIHEGVSNAVDGAKRIAKDFTDTISNLWTNFVGFFTDIGTKIANIARDIYNNVTGFFNNLFNDGKRTFETLGSNLSDIWWGIYNSVTGVASTLINSVSGTFQWGKDVVTNIWDGITWALTHPVDAAYWAMRNIVDSIKNLFNFQFSMPHIKLPHITWTNWRVGDFTFPVFNDIQWYAKGGIFDGATIAGLGESGPEAVVPLSGARMKPFADAVAENLNGAQVGTAPTMQRSDDAFIAAVSSAVYNAVVKGFPKKIQGDAIMDGEKVGTLIDNSKRRTGSGTSLVR